MAKMEGLLWLRDEKARTPAGPGSPGLVIFKVILPLGTSAMTEKRLVDFSRERCRDGRVAPGGGGAMELCLGELVAPDITGNIQVEGRSEQGAQRGNQRAIRG